MEIVLSKYRNRERNRILDVYHKAANEIIKIALKTNSAIALENLKNISQRFNYSPIEDYTNEALECSRKY